MIEVEVLPEVINDAYIPYLRDDTRTQIFYGGSSSGKSVFLAQRAVADVMQGDRNYLICRAVGRTIRGSVFTEIKKVISDWGVGDFFDINKTDMLITCVNGRQIIFAGLDDVDKLKSLTPLKGSITDIWIEEATETERATVKQLYKRQRGGSGNVKKRLTMSFNPIMQNHWIYQEYFKNRIISTDQREYRSEELVIVKTWYIHNKFLTPDDIHDLESETDEYYRDVYTFGNWGILGDVIFRNWKVLDLSDMRNQFTNRRNGLDFGFSSDPAAVSCSHYDTMRKTIYIYDELYETGMENDKLAESVITMIGDDIIICDSAEPKSISELRKYGVNAYPAEKGKDSVNFGIQWLKQQSIVIHSECINTKNEMMQYHWRKDAGGNTIRQPVDKNNHLIDALRYAYEGDSTNFIDSEDMVSWV